MADLTVRRPASSIEAIEIRSTANPPAVVEFDASGLRILLDARSHTLLLQKSEQRDLVEALTELWGL